MCRMVMLSSQGCNSISRRSIHALGFSERVTSTFALKTNRKCFIFCLLWLIAQLAGLVFVCFGTVRERERDGACGRKTWRDIRKCTNCTQETATQYQHHQVESVESARWEPICYELSQLVVRRPSATARQSIDRLPPIKADQFQAKEGTPLIKACASTSGLILKLGTEKRERERERKRKRDCPLDLLRRCTRVCL